MSIRHLALYILVAGLSIYAWKDWFKSLCGLVLLMAIMEHEDMPRTMFGIQGLNMWNVLFGIILLAWISLRHSQGLRWDMPGGISILLLMYLGVIVIGVFAFGFGWWWGLACAGTLGTLVFCPRASLRFWVRAEHAISVPFHSGALRGAQHPVGWGVGRDRLAARRGSSTPGEVRLPTRSRQ